MNVCRNSLFVREENVCCAETSEGHWIASLLCGNPNCKVAATDLARVVDPLRKLVELGAMDAAEAFERLSKMAEGKR